MYVVHPREEEGEGRLVADLFIDLEAHQEDPMYTFTLVENCKRDSNPEATHLSWQEFNNFCATTIKCADPLSLLALWEVWRKGVEWSANTTIDRMLESQLESFRVMYDPPQFDGSTRTIPRSLPNPGVEPVKAS